MRKFFLILFSSIALSFLRAQPYSVTEGYFWEFPAQVSSGESYFPTSARSRVSGNSFVFFQEVDSNRKEISISMIKNDGSPRRILGPFRYYRKDVPTIYSAAVSNGGTIAVSVVKSTSASNGVLQVYTISEDGEILSSFDFANEEKLITSSMIYPSSSGGFTMFVSLGSGISDTRLSTFSIFYTDSSDGKNWGSLKGFSPSAGKKNPYTPFLAQSGGKDIVAFEAQEEQTEDQKGLNYPQIFSAVRSAGGEWSAASLLTSASTVIEKGSDYKFYKNYRPYLFSDGSGIKVAWERILPDTAKANVFVADISSDGTVKDKSSVVNLNENSAVDARRPLLFSHGGKVYCLWFDDSRNMNVNNVQMAYATENGWKTLMSLPERQDKNVPSAFACPAVFRRDGKEIVTLYWQGQVPSGGNRIFFLDRDKSVKKPEFEAKNFTLGKHSDKKKPSLNLVMPKDASEITGYQVAWSTKSTHSFSDDEPVLSAADVSFTGNVTDWLEYNRILSGKDGEVDEEALSSAWNKDQRWYCHVRAKDAAGNWSDCSTMEYYYDVTPPRPVRDIYFAKDSFGFSSSNFVQFEWKKGDGDNDIAGYSYDFSLVGSLEKKYQTKSGRLMVSADEARSAVQKITSRFISSRGKKPDKKIDCEEPRHFFNQERKNGVFMFSVIAVDDVGLTSEVSKVVVILNKYKTKSTLTDVQVTVDEMGGYNFVIKGDELLYDGEVTDVVVTDEKGRKTVFSKSKGDFKISADGSKEDSEIISGIRIIDLKPGTYVVSVRHTEKGEISFRKKILLTESGTIKFERDFSLEPLWRLLDAARPDASVDTDRILYILLMLVIALGIFGCIKGIISTVRASLIVKMEVNALMTGGVLPMEKKIMEEEIDNYTKVRFSLKKKLSLFTVVLLMLIIAAVALTIGSRLSRIQETTLIDGLRNRVQIAFGSISSGCQMNMQDLLDLPEIENADEKSARADSIRSERINPLVSITDNFSEAQYAIILSYNINNYLSEEIGNKDGSFDYVWAASSSTPGEIIDQMEIDGRTQIKVVDEEIIRKCSELRQEAKEKLSDLRNRNAAPGEIRSFFNDFSRENFGAVPYFNEDRLDMTHSEYMFFWPVFDTVDYDLLAVALMEVDTHALISSVNTAKKNILIISLSAAAVALIIGIISALSLASVIVNPIKKVVAHVQGITNEKDKEKLAGIKIEIKSHDEIRTLGDEVNKMTENLVEGARSEKRAKKAIEESARAREAQAEAQARLAAEAQKTAEAQQKANEILKESLEKAKMDNDGKIVQKSLVPLNKGRGEKESVASFKDSKIDLYCYYEGADDVSGDYFNYKKLDDRWYAVIKCDVSGHGIPAALLVAVVSTLFGEYFSNWSFKTHGTRINELITKINETVCSYELTGKFVAVFLALIDTKTGDVYMCNAGDSIVHHFDSKSKTQKELHLNIIPATGMFDQFMIDMRGGYQVEKKLVLNKGDVLFLYTDGIEESVRFFRDENFNVISCTETKDVTQGKGPRDLVHKTHNVGTQSEELGNNRIKEIVEAVYNKKKYVLKKYHTPHPKEVLEFDFSKCDGTIEDSILALAAIDKIFRFYKKPDAKGSVQKTDNGIVIDGDGIRIDRKIDAFLKKTFSLYDFYCHDQVDMGEQNYIYYVNLNEDVQADDLTIFAVKRL